MLQKGRRERYSKYRKIIKKEVCVHAIFPPYPTILWFHLFLPLPCFLFINKWIFRLSKMGAVEIEEERKRSSKGQEWNFGKVVLMGGVDI